MSSFPRTPYVLKGGIVLLDPTTSQVQRIIVLQYNPDTITRSLQVQAVSEGSDRSEALRLKGPPVETFKVEAEIDAANERFLQELAHGDAAAAASAYEEHAVLLPPAGEGVRGRKAIERFWQSGIEIGVRAVELEPLDRRGAGPVVYETGRYRIILRLAEGQPTLEHGAYVAFHRQRRDGSWLRVADTFNREPSQTPARAWVTKEVADDEQFDRPEVAAAETRSDE